MNIEKQKIDKIVKGSKTPPLVEKIDVNKLVNKIRMKTLG